MSGEKAIKRVVCLCPSYGRPKTTMMLAWMFLQQTYPNSFLYILDDSNTYVSEYDNHNIKLELKETRFPSLPDKYNYMIKRARELFDPEIFMVWENDDWYFPWHISAYISAFNEAAADFVHSDFVYVCDGNQINIKATNRVRYHASLAFHSRIASENFYPANHYKGFDVILLENLNRYYKRASPKFPKNVYSYCWFTNNPEFPQGSGWVIRGYSEVQWYNELGKRQISKGNEFTPALYDRYVQIISRLLPGAIDISNNCWNTAVLEKNLAQLYTEKTPRISNNCWNTAVLEKNLAQLYTEKTTRWRLMF